MDTWTWTPLINLRKVFERKYLFFITPCPFRLFEQELWHLDHWTLAPQKYFADSLVRNFSADSQKLSCLWRTDHPPWLVPHYLKGICLKLVSPQRREPCPNLHSPSISILIYFEVFQYFPSKYLPSN